MGIRQILVPIDYSDNSKVALAYASELAIVFGASLDIVHVWDRPTYVTDAVMVQRPGEAHKPIGELIRENAQHDMDEFISGITLPNGVATKTRLLSGDPASTLVAELKKGEHDLVVLSTHGRTGVAHLLLGSIAEKLVRLSPVPVLTVPLSGHR
ncbi:MAG TPA: universal stress protein [Polyangiaceae bacterium]|jgi:nucleotide-binding universal stress UspA family protein|nr:universal stress protein [Polyangiaceae bacterium]